MEERPKGFVTMVSFIEKKNKLFVTMTLTLRYSSDIVL